MSFLSKRSPGQRAHDRCFLAALVVMIGLVVTPYFHAGEWLPDLCAAAGIPFSDFIARGVPAAILLGLFAWGLGGVVRTWKDPGARVGRVISLAALAFLLLVAVDACGVFPHYSHPTNDVPGDVWWALRRPDRVTFYSIDPRSAAEEMLDDEYGGVRSAPKHTEQFHGHGVMGKTDLDGKAAAAPLAEFHNLLRQQSSIWAACFQPRHGLRVEAAGHEYDFVLCYQCHLIEVYRDGNKIIHRSVSGSPDVLNNLLKQANIPLPPEQSTP